MAVPNTRIKKNFPLYRTNKIWYNINHADAYQV